MSDEPLKRSDNGAGRKNPRFELNNKTRLSCIANMVSAIIPSNDSSANPQGCLLANDDQARQVHSTSSHKTYFLKELLISHDWYLDVVAFEISKGVATG